MAFCPSCCRLHRFPSSSSSSSDGTLLSTKTVSGYGLRNSPSRPPSLVVRSEIGQPAIVLHTIATPTTADLGHSLQKQGSKFADVLGNIANMYSEAGEENRAAADCVQRTVEESGRSAEDYGRRALLFERSGEMAASSKIKGDRLMEELEVLQGDILQRDEGRSAADYLRRAELFSKSAEIFGHNFFEKALP